MRFALAILLSVALALGGIGGAAAKSTKNTKSAKSAKSSSGPLNGGMYSSSQGSPNKGGSYKNPSTGNQYGQRKLGGGNSDTAIQFRGTRERGLSRRFRL